MNLELNTPEAIELLNKAGFSLNDGVIVDNNVDGHKHGFLCNYYEEPKTELIQSYKGTLGLILSCCIYNTRLYVRIEDDNYYILVDSIKKLDYPIFRFASRYVSINFETKIVDAGKDDSTTFESVFKLYGCILALNRECKTKFDGYKLEFPDEPQKISDETSIKFGCQTGTFAQVKAIVDYIKSNLK